MNNSLKLTSKRNLMASAIVVNSLLISPSVLAKNKAKKRSNSCYNVPSCVQLASKLTGVHYTSSKKLKGEVWTSKDFKITRENASRFLSEVLNEHGYTRVKVNDKRFKIVDARDIRYTPTMMLNGNTDKIPDLDDYYMVSYQLKDKEMSTNITRSFRPFMSRYGRIIDLKDYGKIIIQDTGKNIIRLIALVQQMDKVPTKEEKERRQERRERHFELEKLRAKNCHQHPAKGGK